MIHFAAHFQDPDLKEVHINKQRLTISHMLTVDFPHDGGLLVRHVVTYLAKGPLSLGITSREKWEKLTGRFSSGVRLPYISFSDFIRHWEFPNEKEILDLISHREKKELSTSGTLDETSQKGGIMLGGIKTSATADTLQNGSQSAKIQQREAPGVDAVVSHQKGNGNLLQILGLGSKGTRALLGGK